MECGPLWAYDQARFDFYSPEEVWALARAANDEQDAAIYLIGGFAGLRRGEICALRWRDIDFEKRAIRVETNVVAGRVGPTKGGRGRAVPMVREVAEALPRLGQRGYLIGREDPVFPGDGGWLDGSALRRRFVIACEKAQLRVLLSAEDNKAIVGRWFDEFWGKEFNPAIIDELAAPTSASSTPSTHRARAATRSASSPRSSARRSPTSASAAPRT